MRVVPRARASRRVAARAGAAFEVPAAYKTVAPCGSGVLVRVAAAEAVTKGGIVLTESAQRKPTSGACAWIVARRERRVGWVRVGAGTRARGGRFEGLRAERTTRAADA